MINGFLPLYPRYAMEDDLTFTLCHVMKPKIGFAPFATESNIAIFTYIQEFQFGAFALRFHKITGRF